MLHSLGTSVMDVTTDFSSACMLCLCSHSLPCFSFQRLGIKIGMWLVCKIVCYLLTPWSYSSCRTLATSHIICEISWQQIFTGWGHQPHAQPPTWRTRVFLSVWHLPRNLSDMGGPTSSYAAARIALEFIGAHKPPHPATKCFQQGGDTIEGEDSDTCAFLVMKWLWYGS
jgi:hypothetical protein